MEAIQASEPVAIVGRDQNTARLDDGFRLDGTWHDHGFYHRMSLDQPAKTGKHCRPKPNVYTDLNPLQLADVARGLKYLHDSPSVHADLKSVSYILRAFRCKLTLLLKSNILIDTNHCARIADFGLTSVLRQPSVSISVTTPVWGGTPRWMAPELFDGKLSPSKESDIYALGMVTYEV